MKCADCKKTEKLFPLWERIRSWFAWHLFPVDLKDESNNVFTQGFSDGYRAGMEKAKEFQEQRKEDMKQGILMDIKTGTDKKLRNELLAHVLNSPNPDFVLTVGDKPPHLIYLNGMQISDQELFNMDEERKALETWKTWGILQNTLSDMARKTMNEKATTYDDMMSGKLILFALDIQKSILSSIKSLAEFKKKQNANTTTTPK